MATKHLVPADILERYEIEEWRNATGVLTTACPGEWADIVEVLRGFKLTKADIEADGGALSPISKKLNSAFSAKGWIEKSFNTSIKIDEIQYESPTHAVDCYKGRVALEVEWNNKDPFYDRDLNNFRLLFDLRAIHVGVIVTRNDDLKPILKAAGKATTSSTTWLSKLKPRIDGGGGGGCPVLVFGMTKKVCVP